MISKSLLTATVCCLTLSACSSLPRFSFMGEPSVKPKIELVEREAFLRPTRESIIVGDVSLAARESDSSALLKGMAEAAGFTYTQSSAFKVTAQLNNVTVENAIAQLAVAGNKIAVMNYASRSVMLLDKATLVLKAPVYLASRLTTVPGIKMSRTGNFVILSTRGSGIELDAVMSQVRRTLEEDMTKVEMSLEA